MPHQYPRRSLAAIIEGLPITKLECEQEARMLCEYIGLHANADLRVQAWDISVLSVNPFEASGFVSNPFSMVSLEAALRRLEVEFDLSKVVSLPDNTLGEERFGLVTSTRCPILSDPVEGSERLDTALYGATLFLLRREGDYAFVHAPSGYVGWARLDHFKQISPVEWMAWTRRERALIASPIESEGARIPANAILPLDDDGENFLTLGGRRLPLPEGSVTAQERKRACTALRDAAFSLEGTPYVWGGNDAEGIDCSGFVRYCYRAAGFTLPRDADMQFLTGRVAAMPGSEAALELGDLLFFAGGHGRITHVGMALDAERFIHASNEPGVAVDSWAANSFLRERFLSAKRILL